jgi:hypothetical protein
MQQQQATHLVGTAFLVLAFASTLLPLTAALTATPDRVACTFGSTIVIDALANDASDASTLKFKTFVVGAAFASGATLSTVTCGEPPHDCIQYSAPAARNVTGGVLETYRQVRLRHARLTS